MLRAFWQRRQFCPAVCRLLSATPLENGALSTDVKEVLQEKIPVKQDEVKRVKTDLGERSLGNVTVNMCLGGMRGIPGLLWETSLLDPDEGIRFRHCCSLLGVGSSVWCRGYSIPDLQKTLPAAVLKGEPLPEGLLWLLLTGDVPTADQVKSLTEELRGREKLPSHVKSVLDAMPADTHPMTYFSQAILALQPSSRFAKAYEEGVHKSKLWNYYYEDSMDLIAKLPQIAALIYRKLYKNGDLIPPDSSLDWAGNLAHMMGYDAEGPLELMRLYQTIHSDHEGGNVSAHACHLVGSALSDPYLSFCACLNGLAGPLHGLANQEVLRWLNSVNKQLGGRPTKEQLTAFVWETLKSGKVVPGFGHAVLRKTDPRYTCQREFALKHLPDDPMFQLVSDLYEVVPKVLTETGKVKNPWPNVDAHSGVLLQYYGLTEETFYTVLFGVSRALGVLSQGIWSRALGLPIERPKSLTLAALKERATK